MAAEAFLGLTGEGLGFGVFTALATAVVSLATVLIARLAFKGTSSSTSVIFFALPFGTAAVALGLAGSGAGGFVGFAASGAATFLIGLSCGLAVALAFLVTAFGLATGFAAFVGGFATFAGFSSTSATYYAKLK